MKLRAAGRRAVLEDDDGRINGPFSLFLNESKNANTQSSIATSLQFLHFYLLAHRIKLADRAVYGRCLESHEVTELADLAFRPLLDIAGKTSVQLRKLINPTAKTHPKDRDGAVAPNTAEQRLRDIAAFLEFYKRLIEPHIASRDAREKLASTYDAVCQKLRREVGGSVTNAHDLRSVPGGVYMEIMKTIYTRPQAVFDGADEPSRTPERDRAMALLACEGLRPGELGNIRLRDIYTKGQETFLSIESNTKYRGQITTSTPRGKGLDSNTQTYYTRRTIKLWPWTADALRAYEDGERRLALSTFMRDKSDGFLFLKSSGSPVASRRTISLRFEVAESGLRRLGLLAATDDKSTRKATYDFSAYVLRHSAASFFYETKVNEGEKTDAVEDQMRDRFGWSPKSKMPQHYANRAISDRANLTLQEFWRELREEVRRLNKPRHSVDEH